MKECHIQLLPNWTSCVFFVVVVNTQLFLIQFLHIIVIHTDEEQTNGEHIYCLQDSCIVTHTRVHIGKQKHDINCTYVRHNTPKDVHKTT